MVRTLTGTYVGATAQATLSPESAYSWPFSLLGVEIQQWQNAARPFVDNGL